MARSVRGLETGFFESSEFLRNGYGKSVLKHYVREMVTAGCCARAGTDRTSVLGRSGKRWLSPFPPFPAA
jgi:hypothetical protein